MINKLSLFLKNRIYNSSIKTLLKEGLNYPQNMLGECLKGDNYRKNVVDYINHLEMHFDVNRLKFQGIHLWPLIRRMLGERLEHHMLSPYKYKPYSLPPEKNINDLYSSFNLSKQKLQPNSKVNPFSIDELESSISSGSILLYSRNNRVLKKNINSPFLNIGLGIAYSELSKHKHTIILEIYDEKNYTKNFKATKLFQSVIKKNQAQDGGCEFIP